MVRISRLPDRSTISTSGGNCGCGAASIRWPACRVIGWICTGSTRRCTRASLASISPGATGAVLIAASTGCGCSAGGAASAGSQMSLPAMTALGVGLTDLPEVEVYSV